MATFHYKVITPSRAIKEGTADGWFGFLIRRTLVRDGNVVMYLTRSDANTPSRFSFLSLVSMSGLEQILFFRNFSMMLDSGISIAVILETLAGQVRNSGAKNAILTVRQDVMNGQTISAAMSRYPKLFPAYVTKTIAVGEQSGTLSETMDRISVDLEKSYELKRKIVGAIAYPAVILFFMMVVAFMLVIMVLPQITALFADLGAPLPRATVILEAFGTFVMTHPIELLVGLVAFLIGSALALQNRTIRYYAHSALLRLPIFGRLLKEYNLARFTRALTTLLASGITFVNALDTAKGTIKNEAYVQKLELLYPVILHGGLFSDAVRTIPFHFPEQLRQLVAVGEQTGKLRDSFSKASNHYERSVTFQTQMLTTLLEPILMLIAGVLVGFLAYSIFAPLYKVATYI